MAIEREVQRNEPDPLIGTRNRLRSTSIEPREFGLAGTRLLVDRTLRVTHGFGPEQLAASGVTLREVVERRDEVLHVLGRIAEFDGDRELRRQPRSAALRLLGHLRSDQHVELLRNVASGESEPLTHRIAALDALAQVGDPDSVEVTRSLLDHMDDRIVRAAARAIAQLGGEAELGMLVDRLSATGPGSDVTSEQRREHLIRAAATLSARLGRPVELPPLLRRRRTRRGVTSSAT